jgi:hypothetical protein
MANLIKSQPVRSVVFAGNIFLAFFLFSDSSFAQILESTASVSASVRHKIAGIADPQVFGDSILVEKIDGQQISLQPVGIVRVLSKDSGLKIKLRASDAARNPLEVKSLGSGFWEVSGSGRIWIEVTVFDFKRDIFEDQSFVLDIDGSIPGPGPGPNPGPTPDDVPNKYGLGSVAFSKAPREASTAKEYARIYRQSADFLYGRPSLKSVYSPKHEDATNPDKNLLAWIVVQQKAISTSNSDGWKVWHSAINEALIAAQKKTQFSREDWFAALNEISLALEKVK